ncbi:MULTISPECIES: hypothetical protein [Virgibacillus]|uniref:Uncharacterized protein n=1 Tax=Virgibacillus oceani TaxID=1479511 RepID=A0A917LZI1_9BACI|nr:MULTISPECIES: hypothetical protein [Virgibacillus]GGG65932.1 hypothetical protein GCM10011398_06970 [Virgibacillus oceani]
MTKRKGIDVSEQLKDIDWDKVKVDGIQFAMLRIGINSDTDTMKNLRVMFKNVNV